MQSDIVLAKNYISCLNEKEICFFARSSIDRLYSTLLLLKALHKNALTTKKIIVGLNIDREHLISYRIVPSKREKKEKEKRKKKGRKKGEEKVTHASDLDLDLL